MKIIRGGSHPGKNGRDPNDQTDKTIISRLYQLYDKSRKKPGWRVMVMTLAIIVVFITTYGFILPAITIEKKAAEDMPGIQLESGFSQSSDEQDRQTVSDGERPDKKGPDLETGRDSKDDLADEDTGTARKKGREKTDANPDEESVKDKDAERSDGTNDADKGNDTGQITLAESPLKYVGGNYEVELIFDSAAAIPEGTEFQIRKVDTGTTEYSSYKKTLEEALASHNIYNIEDKLIENHSDMRAIKPGTLLRLRLIKDGKEIRPHSPVEVNITYHDETTSRPDYGVVIRTLQDHPKVRLIKLAFDETQSRTTISNYSVNI